MDSVGLLSESVIKVEEIKMETDGDTEESPQNFADELERPVAVFLPVKKEPEDWLNEEGEMQEELRPPAAVFLTSHDVTGDKAKEEEDPLAFGGAICDGRAEQDFRGSVGEFGCCNGAETLREAASSGHFESSGACAPGAPRLPSADERQFECHVCAKSFKRKEHLASHMRFHNGDRPNVCSECQMRFHFKGDLVTHMLTHSAEKPFECTECAKSFKQKKHLMIHRRSHTGERPYKCDVCNKTFLQNGHLLTHSRIHTGERMYRCSVCQKTFQQNAHLVGHMRIHTGDRPFECDVCQRGFYLSGDLVRHQLTHTGERPYECSVCSKRYKSGYAVRVHMRTAHGGVWSSGGSKSAVCKSVPVRVQASGDRAPDKT